MIVQKSFILLLTFFFVVQAQKPLVLDIKKNKISIFDPVNKLLSHRKIRYDHQRKLYNTINKREQSSFNVGIDNYLWSYLVTVGIGYPRKDFNLVIDTGSAILWVPSVKCSQTTCPSTTKNIQYFDPSVSKTYQLKNNNKFALTYGSGEASGQVGQDTITIATQVTKGLLDDGINGIFGLAPSLASKNFNTRQEIWKTPIDQLISNGMIQRNLFSVYFDSTDKEEELESTNGKLTIGGLPDNTTYTGTIQWTNRIINDFYKVYWGIQLKSVHINNKTIGQSLTGITDTGSTMIIFNTQYEKQLMDAFKIVTKDEATDVYYVKCDQVSELPDLLFYLNNNNNKPLRLTPQQYTAPPWQSNYWKLNNQECPLYITTETFGGNQMDFILGQKFLEYHVSIYDSDYDRLGFAPSVHHKG
ncbi:aspartic peptidase domain-containing protein [Cunninghamella echinulata]|nr:aspartic peptidase domain-containing protein [Cunninghamella echinulata]